jgi:hypothetical protein
MEAQKDLPRHRRDWAMRDNERDLLGQHYGLIRAVAWRFRSARIPDLESELSLHACRIVPNYSATVGAFAPWLQACLSRFVLNLVRDNRKHRRCQSETDHCAGGENDLLRRAQSREPQPDDQAEQGEAMAEGWGLQLTALVEPKPKPKPKPRRNLPLQRAKRWIRRNPEKIGRWKGVTAYARLAGVSARTMSKALDALGYSLPDGRPVAQCAQPRLFEELV